MEQSNKCQWGVGGGTGEKKGLSKQHICIAHRHRQYCGVGQGRWEQVLGRCKKKGGKWVTSAIVSTI